jgi:pyruvate/2-oxoglutarate/acetoin dehydrogenase E1 component
VLACQTQSSDTKLEFKVCQAFTGLAPVVVSQSVDYMFSSHLGLIVRVSTQHHMHTFTNELGYPVVTILS